VHASLFSIRVGPPGSLALLPRQTQKIRDDSLSKILFGLLGEWRDTRFVTPFGETIFGRKVPKPAIAISKVERITEGRLVPYVDSDLTKELQRRRPYSNLVADL
jgi:hypothetical protein